MKKKYIVFGLLFLIALLGLYFFAYNSELSLLRPPSKNSPQQKISSSKKNQVSPILSETKKNNSTWLQYKNQLLSFTYPKEATIEAVPADLPTNVKLVYTSKVDSSRNNMADGYSVDIYSLSSTYISFNDYVQQAQEGARIECQSTSSISQISDIRIGGMPAKTFTIENCLANNDISKLYYIEGKNLITQITAKSQGLPENIQEYRNILDQIIGSFSIN